MFASYSSSVILLLSCFVASSVVSAWIAVNPVTRTYRGERSLTQLNDANGKHDVAPKHDVGGAGNPMDKFTPEQLERAQAYMEHQQSVAKLGYPTDVRSLIQYNHGFAVMSTNSKS